MACPRCGGNSYNLIAPGYVECIATVAVQEIGIDGNPHMRPFTCLERYHQPTAGSTAAGAPQVACQCGLFAIGSCPECGTAFCGDHSWPRDGKRLCQRCAARHDEAKRTAADRAKADQARAAAEHSRAVAQQQAADEAALPGLARDAFKEGSPNGRRFRRSGVSWFVRNLTRTPQLMPVRSYQFESRGGYDSIETKTTTVAVSASGEIWSVTDQWASKIPASGEATAAAQVLRNMIAHRNVPNWPHRGGPNWPAQRRAHSETAFNRLIVPSLGTLPGALVVFGGIAALVHFGAGAKLSISYVVGAVVAGIICLPLIVLHMRK